MLAPIVWIIMPVLAGCGMIPPAQQDMIEDIAMDILEEVLEEGLDELQKRS